MALSKTTTISENWTKWHRVRKTRPSQQASHETLGLLITSSSSLHEHHEPSWMITKILDKPLYLKTNHYCFWLCRFFGVFVWRCSCSFSKDAIGKVILKELIRHNVSVLVLMVIILSAELLSRKASCWAVSQARVTEHLSTFLQTYLLSPAFGWSKQQTLQPWKPNSAPAPQWPIQHHTTWNIKGVELKTSSSHLLTRDCFILWDTDRAVWH